MKYCNTCLMPDTKPYIRFDDNGICNACHAHKRKKSNNDSINWQERKIEFNIIVQNAISKKAPFYDALVPVSGGKDSIAQVHRLLKYNIRILAVNVDYGIKTNIGIENLNCISNMGANLMIYRPELKLHKKLIRIGLEHFGDPDLMSHTLLHAFPLHTAIQFKIPLVVLGENSAFEYGGEKEIANQFKITRDWFSKFAANSGHDANFVSTNYNIPKEKLILYDFPDHISSSSTSAVFLSHFFFWDSEVHLNISKKYGFKTLAHPSEGTYRNYVGIDEKINRIHQYLKVLKFGYGRATDHACEDIRNNRISRDDALKLVQKHDTKPLGDYYTDDFCKFINIDKTELINILESYRNTEIWNKDINGNWYLNK